MAKIKTNKQYKVNDWLIGWLIIRLILPHIYYGDVQLERL